MGDDREYGKAYPVAKAIIRPVFKALWRINVSGLQHVPDTGPAIFCPNHISFIDSLVLPAVLPRRISYVGKAEYLDSWKTRHILPAIGMVPIDRSGGSASQRALDTAARILNRGEFFGIYPEGTRARDGYLHRGRTGAARLALRTGSPLIPVGLRGTDEIQPAGASLPRPFRSCQVNIGAPIDVTRYLDRYDDRMMQRQLTDEVMFEIQGLCGREYVDTYAGSKPEEKQVETAPTGEGIETARSSADVLSGNGSRHGSEPAKSEPVTIVPVAAGPSGPPETESGPMDERVSSADVLSRWWS